jgi:hypothetical protein
VETLLDSAHAFDLRHVVAGREGEEEEEEDAHSRARGRLHDWGTYSSQGVMATLDGAAEEHILKSSEKKVVKSKKNRTSWRLEMELMHKFSKVVSIVTFLEQIY